MTIETKGIKPLGHKAYGSIPHLPGSRMGPADHHCHAGQATICLEKTRDRHDRVYVQEKLDGSCVAVARLGDEIVAMGRSGYTAESSPYEQHVLFAAWVAARADLFRSVLLDGERLVGEWLAQAHGTRYDLGGRDPFVAFDIMVGHVRMPCALFQERVERKFEYPRLISCGPTSLDDVRAALATSGHGALDPVEGAVWRVERHGKVDFLAKWVRPDKVDGYYLSRISGVQECWNWRPA